MNILFDYQTFSTQQYGGISRYFYELINDFNHNDEINSKLPLLLSNNYYISDRKYTNHYTFFPNTVFFGKQRIMNELNKVNSIKMLKLNNYDIFHPTYFDPYFLKYLNKKPFVLTVHDLINEKFSQNQLLINQNKNLIEKASKIIAVSEHTKKDLIDLFHIDEEKIEVIYHGNSLKYEKKQAINKKFILFVGKRNDYKNFDNFLDAVAESLIQMKDLLLICIGGGSFTIKESMKLKSMNIFEQVIQKNVDDNMLSAYYQSAQFFVFPSQYEGFGIPILEAFANKCPIACSNTSSLPEIAKDAAIYFDPYNIASIQNAIQTLLNNIQLREELIEKGTERLSFFSWEKASKSTINVYKEVLRMVQI